MPHPKSGYKVDGKSVPGTTTIIGRFKDAGGLLYWACEQGRAIERGEIVNLYDKRDSAGESGTLSHTLVEAHNRGHDVPDLSGYPMEIVLQAKQGFENYIRWQEDNRIEIVNQEIELVSRKYLFGGCPDAIGRDSRGRLCLLDWKTSSTGPYVDWLLQLAAYKILWEENYPDELITGGFHLLKFSKEIADFSHFYWSELDEAKEQFLLFRKAFEIDRRIKKRI